MPKDAQYIELANYPPELDVPDIDNDAPGRARSPPDTPKASTSESDAWLHSLDHSQAMHILERLGVAKFDGPVVVADLSRSAQYMVKQIGALETGAAVELLREALVEHNGDINYPSADYQRLERLIAGMPADFGPPDAAASKAGAGDAAGRFWAAQVRTEAALIHFHSPYPEVRAVVDPFDDAAEPVETVRVYAIALFWTAVGSTINNFFVHRLPGIALSTGTVQLMLLPSGRAWERLVPANRHVAVFGRRFNLNPGPWSSKEMMLASIMYSCAAGTPYAIYNIVVMKLERFYGLAWVGWRFQVCFALSTQFLGFALAFAMLRVCVYPQSAVWPTLLPVLALNRALTQREPARAARGVSRYRFFCAAFAASAAYNWLPAYLCTALSTFNWPTWFAPRNVHLANVAGTNTGLGLNPLPSLDWNVLDMAGCLTVPFYTYANHFGGMALAFGAIVAVYYTNHKWTGYFPINSNRLYDNRGRVYDVHRLLDGRGAFSADRYRRYGPPYFSAANLVLYGAHFFLYPFAVLYHAATEWRAVRSAWAHVGASARDVFRAAPPAVGRFARDPHCRMMARYPEVPARWFAAVFAASAALAVACVVCFPVETPVWGVFLTVALNVVFLVPLTAIASVTGFSFGLNVLVELLVGYAVPNSGLALITLKAYGYNIDSQASNYITDQKLAHYAKIPPRAIFRGQMLATALSVAVALAVANWQMANIPDLCSPDQKNRLRCPGANTYFFASIQYGEIGPKKVFGGVYPALRWCFLLGALAVVPMAYLKHRGPRRWTRAFHPTLVVGGFLAYAPYNLSYYVGGLYLSYYFMYHLKRNHAQWWGKYCYVLTGALSSGVAISSLVIFFVQYAGYSVDWWGNELSSMGIEGMRSPPAWLSAADAPDGYVGLREADFP